MLYHIHVFLIVHADQPASQIKLAMAALQNKTKKEKEIENTLTRYSNHGNGNHGNLVMMSRFTVFMCM